ncbi:MAG: hypothetical protein ACTSO6_10645 [Promethearchaeota archaeon]
MTGQIPDKLIYNKNSYSIVGLKGHGLPAPLDFGLEPISPHTANWRGFVMTYEIVNSLLILQNMDVTVKEMKDDLPLINSITPEAKKEGYINLTYTNLNFKTQFVGKILIAKDFIDTMYVHMGFQSPLSFKKVIELNILDGAMTKFTDFSEIMETYRNNNISDGKHGSTENLQEWIARTFSLDYDFS